MESSPFKREIVGDVNVSNSMGLDMNQTLEGNYLMARSYRTAPRTFEK
jgi:hypothetical protein